MRMIGTLLLSLFAVVPAGAAQSIPAPAASAASAPSQPGPSQNAVVPGPPGAEQSAPEPAEMQSMHVQMEANMERMSGEVRGAQIAMRRGVLSVLSPAQRSLVAATVGELAIAAEPDFATGGERIDAALSPAQRTAIMQLVQEEAARTQAAFRDMTVHLQQMPAQMGAAPPLAHQIPKNSQLVGAGVAMAIAPPFVPPGWRQSAGAVVLFVLNAPGPGMMGPAMMAPHILPLMLPPH